MHRPIKFNQPTIGFEATSLINKIEIKTTTKKHKRQYLLKLPLQLSQGRKWSKVICLKLLNSYIELIAFCFCLSVAVWFFVEVAGILIKALAIFFECIKCNKCAIVSFVKLKCSFSLILIIFHFACNCCDLLIVFFFS